MTKQSSKNITTRKSLVCFAMLAITHWPLDNLDDLGGSKKFTSKMSFGIVVYNQQLTAYHSQSRQKLASRLLDSHFIILNQTDTAMAKSIFLILGTARAAYKQVRERHVTR